MKPFNCWQCGACCKLCDKVEELKHFDRGDGVCIHLLPDNMCAIYENRPEICNTKRSFDKKYAKMLTWDQYLTFSDSACKILDREFNKVMHINIKKIHPDAKIPSYAYDGDAGVDLTAVAVMITGDYIEYDLGIAVEIPKGYVGLLFPRSSLSKYDLSMCNHVGVIDSNYRNSIKARFKTTKQHPKVYSIGDRVAQLIIMPIPTIRFHETLELSSTDREDKGFGSSGN